MSICPIKVDLQPVIKFSLLPTASCQDGAGTRLCSGSRRRVVIRKVARVELPARPSRRNLPHIDPQPSRALPGQQGVNLANTHTHTHQHTSTKPKRKIFFYYPPLSLRVRVASPWLGASVARRRAVTARSAARLDDEIWGTWLDLKRHHSTPNRRRGSCIMCYITDDPGPWCVAFLYRASRF